jgi:hypothetical protein
MDVLEMKTKIQMFINEKGKKIDVSMSFLLVKDFSDLNKRKSFGF